MEYVSTAKERERRWRFFQIPLKGTKMRLAHPAGILDKKSVSFTSILQTVVGIG